MDKKKMEEHQKNWHLTRQVATTICLLAELTASNPEKIAKLLKDYLFDDDDIAELQKEFDLYNSRNWIDEFKGGD